MNVIAETEKITVDKCKPLTPPTIDQILSTRSQVPSDVAPIESPPVPVGKMKDMIIISLTGYGVRLNAVVADCMAELKAKDEYAERLRKELE